MAERALYRLVHFEARARRSWSSGHARIGLILHLKLEDLGREQLERVDRARHALRDGRLTCRLRAGLPSENMIMTSNRERLTGEVHDAVT